MRHIISILMENESGSLSRVSGLFSARGYNIESLTVAPTHDPSLSRMTIVTIGDDRKIDQIEKHLNKLVDVAALQDITVDQHVEKEVALIKVQTTEAKKQDLDNIMQAFDSNLEHLHEHCYLVELTGSSEKIDELVKSLSFSQTVIETARSGVIGLSVSKHPLSVSAD